MGSKDDCSIFIVNQGEIDHFFENSEGREPHYLSTTKVFFL